MKAFFQQAKELMEGKPSKQCRQAVVYTVLWYEKSKHRVFLDLGATMASFQLSVFLVTGVLPARQKILLNNSTPMEPNADLSKLFLQDGVEMTLEQLPWGQEVEPISLTKHLVDRIGSKCIVMEEQANALEALLLVKRLDVDAELPKKLLSLTTFMHDAAQKLLLKVDEIEGEEPHRQARKVEKRRKDVLELSFCIQMFVHKMNSVLDRLERMSQR
ncbi:hypothetical protein GUITHDRAFT_114651 [Guillardia theta CCMP2712]|uniref:Uncharacterized protein n=1 Tax=Guillardia theta (strain CCMP2712) TaxID=905079 RepID=L1ISG8_GUITC|nr:hypothetical protein GUITHDRAFT_114651 [Guillardia theta CCMP2712]EKX39216.1 hypothetical protein GUITHDRAFT_114651 [Guillardia theta CCMP2712]|eukprot:XP_005826196.1 hypothetical protein GUITHDRAFT_114651 [Guillardia theta CCMP2712]